MTSKSENLRYSIIPARAITDPTITAQALRVLALLGRHAADNGWCRRSQVKMAQELGCSRGTVQNALELLIGRINGEGYVERREETRAGVEPEEGRHPHCSYSYRVRLDLGDEKRPTRASLLAPVVPASQHGVPTNDQHGVPTSLAPLIEHSLSEHPPCEQTQRARENAAAEGKTKTGFERWWGEYRRVVGWQRDWSKAAAQAAWDRLTERPPDAALIEATRRYVRHVADENARRDKRNPKPPYHPATWLTQRCFEGFLHDAGAGDDAAQHNAHKLATAITIYGDHAKPLIARIGAPAFAEWFWDTEFFEAERRIEAASEFRARSIGDGYGNALRNILGDDLVIVVKKSRERAA